MTILPFGPVNMGQLLQLQDNLADLGRRISTLESAQTVINDAVITGPQVAPAAITTSHIQAGAITSALISAGAITANLIAAGAINAVHLAANAVTASSLAADSVSSANIIAGTIQGTDIAADAITTAHLAAGSVTASEIFSDVNMANQLIATMGVAGSLAVTTGLSAISANIGAITAGTITGATVQTAGSGNRLVISSAGVTAYGQTTTPGDTVRLSFDNATGNLAVSGTVTANTASILPVKALNGPLGGNNYFRNARFDKQPNGLGGTANVPSVLTDSTATWVAVPSPSPVGGANCVRVVAGNPGAIIYSSGDSDNRIPAVAGQRVALSAYTYTTLSGKQARMVIRAFDSTGTLINRFTGDTNYQNVTANAWTRITDTFTAPANTSFITAEFGWLGATSDTFYVTGVQMEYGDKPTGWAPRPDETLPDSITAAMVVAGAITTRELNAGSITALELTVGNARLGMLKANSVDTIAISANSVNAGHIQAGAITADKLTVGISGMNFVRNGSFEVGANLASAFDNWSLSSAAWATDTDSRYGGRAALITRATGSGADDYIWQDVTLMKGTYTASVWMKWSGLNLLAGSGGAGMNLDVMSGTINFVRNNSPELTALGYHINGAAQAYDVMLTDSTSNGNWVRLSSTITITSATATIRLHCQKGYGGNAEGTVRFDGAQIEEGEIATGWTQFIDHTVIEGSTITAGTFQTARTGARVILDSTGLNYIDSTGANSVNLSAAGGGLTLLPDSGTWAGGLSYTNSRAIRWVSSTYGDIFRVGGATRTDPFPSPSQQIAQADVVLPGAINALNSGLISRKQLLVGTYGMAGIQTGSAGVRLNFDVNGSLGYLFVEGTTPAGVVKQAQLWGSDGTTGFALGRVVGGTISAAGNVLTGTGFTVSKAGGTGVYNITWPAFSSVPAVTGNANAFGDFNVTIDSITTTGCRFIVWGASGGVDQPWSFIAFLG